MSRSYRHSDIVKQQNTKGMKQYANRKVRRCYKNDDLPMKGKSYKKLFQSWDICDWKWIWTKQEAIEEWNRPDGNKYYSSYLHRRYGTLEEYLKYWEKCTKRK